MINDFFDVAAVILVIDSLAAVLLVWFGRRWYLEHLAPITRWLPPAKGWAVWYFLLALLFLASRLMTV